MLTMKAFMGRFTLSMGFVFEPEPGLDCDVAPRPAEGAQRGGLAFKPGEQLCPTSPPSLVVWFIPASKTA